MQAPAADALRRDAIDIFRAAVAAAVRRAIEFCGARYAGGERKASIKVAGHPIVVRRVRVVPTARASQPT